MGGNHRGKKCSSPEYAKGFTAHVTITVYTTAWKLMAAQGYKCDHMSIGGHYLWRKQHSIYIYDWNGQTIITILSVGKKKEATSSSSSLPPSSFAGWGKAS